MSETLTFFIRDFPFGSDFYFDFHLLWKSMNQLCKMMMIWAIRKISNSYALISLNKFSKCLPNAQIPDVQYIFWPPKNELIKTIHSRVHCTRVQNMYAVKLFHLLESPQIWQILYWSMQTKPHNTQWHRSSSFQSEKKIKYENQSTKINQSIFESHRVLDQLIKNLKRS